MKSSNHHQEAHREVGKGERHQAEAKGEDQRDHDERLVEEIAHQMVAWVQEAIDDGMLSLDDRPLKWVDFRG